MLQDLRFALRSFRRSPLATAIALTSIALSVGAITVVFTAIKFVLLRPLPYSRPAELVEIGTEIQHIQGFIAFWDDMQTLIARNRTLSSVAVYGNAVFDLGGDGNTPPESLYGLRMTANLFPTLGVSPLIGRNIAPDEERNGGTEMILNYEVWVHRFHSDPRVVGRAVTVNGHDCIVVGVMPSGFDFPLLRAAAHTPSAHVQFWAPLGKVNNGAGMGAIARLRAGVTVAQVRQDLASITPWLAHRDRVLRAAPLVEDAVGGAR